MNKLKSVSKNALITIAPAVIVYLLFMAVTNLFVGPGFGVGGDLRTTRSIPALSDWRCRIT